MSSKAVVFALFVALAAIVAAYDQKDAVGPCIMGRCPPSHVCSNGECYPKMKDAKSLGGDFKAVGAIGPCVNGYCPRGHECQDNKCFKSVKRSIGAPIGPCIGGDCPAGYSCNRRDNKCYA